MIPKEKALELIEKFKKNDYDWIALHNDHCVRQHALVAVDEILQIIANDFEAIGYWNEVKTEIETFGERLKAKQTIPFAERVALLDGVGTPGWVAPVIFD